MAKIKINSNKSFGIVFSIIFLIIATYPILSNNNVRLWSLILSVIFMILGLKNSNILSPLNKIWFKFGLLLGKIISPIIMGLIFFCIITPTAIILRLFNKDVLNLKKKNTETYWIKKTSLKSKMKNQF
jgi:hypothetical protein